MFDCSENHVHWYRWRSSNLTYNHELVIQNTSTEYTCNICLIFNRIRRCSAKILRIPLLFAAPIALSTFMLILLVVIYIVRPFSLTRNFTRTRCQVTNLQIVNGTSASCSAGSDSFQPCVKVELSVIKYWSQSIWCYWLEGNSMYKFIACPDGVVRLGVVLSSISQFVLLFRGLISLKYLINSSRYFHKYIWFIKWIECE